MHERPGTPEFLAEYRAAIEADTPAPTPRPANAPPKPLSLRWLVVRYFGSEAYRRLAPRTRRVRKGILDRLCETNGRGEHPFRLVRPKHIRKWRDEKADKPGSANNLLKALRHLFAWAVEDEQLDESPAEPVKLIRVATEGWHTWSIEEVRQYVSIHPEGSKAHLALTLLLFTGVRISDVVAFGRQMERNEDGGRWLHFTETKGRGQKIKLRRIPMLPELQAVIDRSAADNLTYLISERGRPFSAASFGARFRKWCDAAGLPHCTAHGLRKAGATIAADNGATAHQLMAIFGWEKIDEAEIYTRKANRRRLAAEAMPLLAVPFRNKA